MHKIYTYLEHFLFQMVGLTRALNIPTRGVNIYAHLLQIQSCDRSLIQNESRVKMYELARLVRLPTLQKEGDVTFRNFVECL